MPLLACWKEGPGLIPPEVLESAVRRVQHRWPTVVMNLPYTCPPETISSGVAMANHVFLIADRHHAGHEWLYQPGHQLSTLARDNRVTVLTLGGQSKISHARHHPPPPHRTGLRRPRPHRHPHRPGITHHLPPHTQQGVQKLRLCGVERCSDKISPPLNSKKGCFCTCR